MIKNTILSFLFIVSSFLLKSQDINFLLGQAEQLENQKKETEALTKYQEAIRLSPNDIKALCKISELSSILGNRSSDKKIKSEYYTAALMYAERALKQNPLHAQANFTMGLAKAKLTEISSPKEKIQFVREIKSYADKAIAADPQHYPSLHLLGKWHVEVAGLSGAEKAAVKLFGGLPAASIADAIQLFEQVRKIRPSFILNYLDLAKAYKLNGRSDLAIDILNKLIKLAPRSADDESYKAEGKKLLESLL
ncbi:MAG: tetratricopeptide repeat protein [Chitinophagaceae bacterium]